MPAATSVLNGRYEMGPELGHGGMARVHEGRDRTLDRRVAIKVLSSPYDHDAAFLKRFRREAHAAARLSHPNVVAVFDSGSDDGTHYIVTELVDGETLGATLDREGSLQPGRAIEIAIQVCEGLAAAHERGVVHRDVKPGNVMLTTDEHVKVVDFGIARAAGVESLTRTGLMLGSAPYLSPEQARGEPGDERSDIYALGCVLYQMLTGRPPFVADSPIAALYQHVNEPVVPPSTFVPIPPPLERAVLRCLEKEPSSRFASARELALALADVELDRSDRTMPLPVAEVETAPVPRVEPETAPVPRVERLATPVVAEQVAALEPSRARSSPPPDRSPPVPWQIAGLVALGLIIVAAIAFAFGPVDLPSKADLRREARQSRTPSQEPATAQEGPGPSVASQTPSVVDEPATVEEALEALQATIAAELSSGQISQDAAEKLQGSAGKVFEKYLQGDLEKLVEEFDKLMEELNEVVEEGEVFSVEASDRIEAAIADLELAIENDPPQSSSDGDDEGDD